MRSALSPSFDETTCSAAEAAAQERYPDVAREYDIHRYAEGRATLQVSSVGAVVDYYTRVIGERRAVRADALMRYRNESEMGGASMGTIFAVEDSLQSLAVIVVEASLTLCQLWHYSPYHPEPIQADMLDELSALARLTRETSDEVHAATTHAD